MPATVAADAHFGGSAEDFSLCKLEGSVWRKRKRTRKKGKRRDRRELVGVSIFCVQRGARLEYSVNSELPVSGGQCVYRGSVGIGNLLFPFSTLFVVERFWQSTGEGQRGNEPWHIGEWNAWFAFGVNARGFLQPLVVVVWILFCVVMCALALPS